MPRLLQLPMRAPAALFALHGLARTLRALPPPLYAAAAAQPTITAVLAAPPARRRLATAAAAVAPVVVVPVEALPADTPADARAAERTAPASLAAEPPPVAAAVAVELPASRGDVGENGEDGAAPTAPTSRAAAADASGLGMYSELCKARLSSLVVMTTGAGFLMAGPPGAWTAGVAAAVGTSLAAGAAGTFNQVWERVNDAAMRRTARRPLPSGRITAPAALRFGGALTAASAGVLMAGANPLVAGLGMFNIALYALVYTPLKTRSELNTAVGALVGAIPPVMGWAAATGNLLAPEPLLLAALLFWWQFPHFYALAWTHRRDYARGGFAMVPVSDPTGKRTAWYALRSAVALATLPFAAAAVGVASPMFAVEGAVLNAYFLWLAGRFYAAPSDATARALFRASLWYLPLLMGLLVFHSVHWQAQQAAGVEAGSGAEAEVAGAQPLEGGLVLGGAAGEEGEADAASTAWAASSHAADAARAAAGGAPPPRGGAPVSTNPATLLVTEIVGLTRDAGRALCVHESIKDAGVDASAALARALCPVPVGGGGGGGGSGGGGSAGSPVGPVVGLATSAGADAASAGGSGGSAEVTAREQSRARCPVVTLEAAGRAAADALGGGSVR